MLSLSPTTTETKGGYLNLYVLCIVGIDEEENQSDQGDAGTGFEDGGDRAFMDVSLMVRVRVSMTEPVVCVFLPGLAGKVFPFHFSSFNEWFVT